MKLDCRKKANKVKTACKNKKSNKKSKKSRKSMKMLAIKGAGSCGTHKVDGAGAHGKHPDGAGAHGKHHE